MLLAAQPSGAIRAWRDGEKFQPLEAPASGGSGDNGDSGSVYIVHLSSAPPLVEYRGGIAGYLATATWEDGSSENNGDDAVPEIDLQDAASNDAEPAGPNAASSTRRAAKHEAVDLDDTTTTPSSVHSAADIANHARSSTFSGPNATVSSPAASNGGNGERKRRRMRLSMDRPHMAAFATLLQRQQAQVASEAGFLKLPGKVWPAVGGQSKAGYGTVVGIVDTGIWTEHSSFSNQGMSSKLRSGCKGKSTGCRHAMATATARGARAPAGNPVSMHGGGQMSGMAPAARLAVYKVYWSRNNGSGVCNGADIAAAINQAVADRVDVISISLPGVDPSQDYFSDLLYLRTITAGVFVALAAGNGGAPGRSQGGVYRTVANFGPFALCVGASHARNVY
ncbi:unnamed protein product [Closterium sp. NIES-65]|nr:unnamed protein product [Closterium sp. NIES-65]